MQRINRLNLVSRKVRGAVVAKGYSASTIMRMSTSASSIFAPTDTFMHRHIGSQGADKQAMLDTVGYSTLDELMDVTIPDSIKAPALVMEPAMSESEALNKLKSIMSKNIVNKSFIGMGYYETLCPGVILRNVLENPGWYTSYTPYQAEISQGRLTSLLNFQTMIADLTGFPLSNSSLLDEATAAAEAMSMCYSLKLQKKKKFFVDVNCHPQNIALVQTRGDALGLTIEVGDVHSADLDMSSGQYCGVLVQYPDTYGGFGDWTDFTALAKSHGTMTVASTDLMASTLLKPAGEMGFDIAVGSAQRFGVPMGYGGPHAAFLATTDAYSRKMPARIIGVSIDSRGKPALRMAMQTREQHIRRDKATSNICTAQALLANMAAFYGCYHGPKGVKAIANRINGMTAITAKALTDAGFTVVNKTAFFDTIVVDVSAKGMTGQQVQDKAAANGCNLRVISDKYVGISFGEAITEVDTLALMKAFGVDSLPSSLEDSESGIPSDMARTTDYMTHPNFNTYHSETQMLRYLKHLEDQDLALNFSMISLGSCTMKLNASVEMFPVTWPETANMHPFCPPDQALGYKEMNETLNRDLAEITGFAAVSSQPNSGAQGEFAGLLAIKSYQEARGQGHRNICLIPVSAHGTNPASACMVGYKVVVVKSDGGIIDVKDLKEKAEKHKDNLAALMVTYPSTYGVFEEAIRDITDCVHSHGGQVYMDGANMNAQVALTSPGYIGADVCHLNLHKTFCIPHGGGGPGVGSIGVAKHLAPHLPGHPVHPTSGEGDNVQVKSTGAVAAAPIGSAAILPISWMYIKMLGEAGLKESTGMAILNANYMAKRLEDGYSIVYKGANGTNAHEFILDLRSFKEHGIVEEDVAKRLQDYGFHSPTMSWPVPGTLMIEPTESEDKAQMDLFCDAMLLIRKEIEDIVQGRVKVEESALHRAPHTMDMVYSDEWDRPYTRKEAAFPAPWVNEKSKFWPTIGRVDNVYGDRNLVCTCPPMSVYEEVPV